MDLSPELERYFKDQNYALEKFWLRPEAYPSENAERRSNEKPSFRPAFGRDADRILHSLSFARFFDKTQVFFWIKSDIHQHRMLHVQLVSKIARYVARMLRLNEDLVEAISLGHDIGHVPMGHDGERVLSDLCEKHKIGKFYHNYESVWFLQEIEMQNLTLPVLDGILCHNGERHHSKLEPDRKNLSWKNLDHELLMLSKGVNLDPVPKTLEACVVRFVDTISYISRDVMDAENLGFLKFEMIPENVKKVLGSSNRAIINTLTLDLLQNSNNHDYVAYSASIFSALQELYQFNYKNIYIHPDKLNYLPVMRNAFGTLWDHFYDDLIHHRTESKIYTDHLFFNLNQIRTRYPEINSLEKYPYATLPAEIIVRDFIAGCTDQYFWKLAQEIDPELKFNQKEIY